MQLTKTRLLALAACLSFLAVVTAQWDPSTGKIMPSPGVPNFDPAPWATAYQTRYSSIPFAGGEGLGQWPNAPISNVNTPQDCSKEGFDSSPAQSVKWGTCFYKNNTDGNTFDFWVKQPGISFHDGNCYCYALNHFEGAYCVPGTSQGGRSRNQYRTKMTCPALNQALLDDGAVKVTRQQALSGGQPSSGHYIAIMARPDNSCVPGHCSSSDFHAMRKDSSSTWSYKFPHTAPSDRDLAGNPIIDPEAAPLPGHYFVCGYFQVDPLKMPLGMSQPEAGPLYDMYDVDRYRKTKSPKTRIDITPVPYNPATDAPVDSDRQRTLQEDAAWERKRGTQEYEQWKQQQMTVLEMQQGQQQQQQQPQPPGATGVSDSRGGSNVARPDSKGSSLFDSFDNDPDFSFASDKKSSSGRKLKMLL